MRDDVARLRSRGFAVCRPDPKEKLPKHKGWSSASLEAKHFTADSQVGIIGGSLSNGGNPGHALVILDLDTESANRFADELLPKTGMEEGRSGKPRSHRYYLVPVTTIPHWGVSTAQAAAPAAAKATGHSGPFTKSFHERNEDGTVGRESFKFIGTGAQAVCPPSLHSASGTNREWEGGSEPGEPTVVDFMTLWTAVCDLAGACGCSIPDVIPHPYRGEVTRVPTPIRDRVIKYLAACPGAVSGANGHNETFKTCVLIVGGFDMHPGEALPLLMDHYNPKCVPQWSEVEMRHKVEDAGRVPYKKPKGWLRDAPLKNGQVATTKTSKPLAKIPAVAGGILERIDAGTADYPENPEPPNNRITSVFPTELNKPDLNISVNPWPDAIKEDALIGLAGDVVRAIAPDTEADPVAILSQFLVGFGNMIGRKCYYRVEATRHYPNLFSVLVGQSSRARKGTSWQRALRILERGGDPSWCDHRILSGLSSGEGLIYEVRDEQIRLNKDREKIVDEGVKDKRLLVIEEEFASVLAVGKREGSILGSVLRSAWDTGNLGTLTKHSPTRCKKAHISIVSHITRAELVTQTSTTQAHNGFLNRFLWFAVKRSNILPFGGCETRTETIAPRLEDAWKFAAGNEIDDDRELIMAEETKEMWPAEYRRLTQDRDGLFGAVTSRSEAQVIRLALVYALLDSSLMITPKHLIAALAVERYVEQSARHVFGDLTGDPITDEINSFLRNNPAGLTQTQISDYFSRNVTRDTLQKSLSELLSTGKATKEEFKKPGPGRPTIMWRPVLTEAKTD